MISYSRWLRQGSIMLLGLGMAACQRLPTRPSHITTPQVSPPLSPGQPLVIPARPATTLRATYLNVGAGMCHVIQCPGVGAPVLVDDCGSTDSTDGLTRQQAVDAVKALVGTAPVVLVLSHRDADHVNYLPEIFSVLPPGGIRTLWAGGQFADYGQTVQDWLKATQQAKVSVRMDGFPAPGVVGFPAGWSNGGVAVPELACGTAKAYVLTVNSKKDVNAASLMLRLDYGGDTLILPGDATGSTQAQAIENAVANKQPASFLHSDVLEMSHHGALSKGSNDHAWAEATIPRILIASSGNRYKHPRCLVLDNYAKATGTRLLGAPSHTFACGVKGGSWDPSPTSYAVFSTYKSGLVTVDVQPPLGAAPRIKVYCNDVQCLP